MRGGFDEKFDYQRNIKESFQYLNALKNGSKKELKATVMKTKNTGKNTAAGQTKMLGNEGMEL